MRTFALGIGECGRKIGLELFRTTNENMLENVNKMHVFSLIDLAEVESQMSNVLKMGIHESDVNTFQPSGTELQAEFNLFIGRIKPIFGERGVGGLWFHSKEIAEEAWDDFHEMFKYHLEEKEWYNIFHSGGGGTGCGAGPVFLEKMYSEVRGERNILSENLYTATLTLPHEHWEPWREANSAAAIGRHSRIAHGIIIADNLQGQVLVRNATNEDTIIETEDSRELINKRLAEVWISLQMTNIAENRPYTKIYEAADYRRLFMNEKCAGILIPCYREYALAESLKGGLNLKGVVFDTMKNHQLTAFELRDFENVIVIIQFPSTSTGLVRNVVENKDNVGDIADFLLRTYGGHLEPAVVFAYSQSLVDTMKVTILVKDPYVPRFLTLKERLRTIVEDPNEMRKALDKMFPREFDGLRRNQIMESAEEEFRKAYHRFSEYLREQGYDKYRFKEEHEISETIGREFAGD